MIEMPAHQGGEVVAWVKLDDDDAQRFEGHKLTLTANGYIRVSGHRLTYLHRLLLGLEPGDKRQADHINHDRLDNRRVNLRIVSRRDNMHNQPSRGGSSEYRGVSWSDENGGWRAQCRVDGVHYALGTFASEEEAAAVAREFRRRNMPASFEGTEIGNGKFRPVWLPEERRLENRVSQTFLSHYNSCPRSGYLYATTKGLVTTPEMQRGSAVHAVLERATKTMIEQGENTIPGEIVKVIVNEVLADPEFSVPIEEHDLIREASYRFAASTAIDPAAVVACETLFVLDLAGYQVRAKIDFAELLEEGAAVLVRDYKSSRAAPTQEDVARVRPDGTLHAKNIQLVIYALALAYGVPVRVETCTHCGGTGEVGEEGRSLNTMSGLRVPDPQLDTREDCDRCDGGRIEIPEPFPVAGRAQRFDLEFVFPAIEDREGRMLRRPLTLTRLELEEYKASLAGLLERVRTAENEGNWPAVVSDHACGRCPAATLCPIPAELRDHRGTINTPEEFAEAVARLEVEKRDHRARQAEARAFLKAHGGRLEFDGKVAELAYSEHETIVDRDALFLAVERARLYGEPFDRSEHVKTKGSTSFKTRDLTVDDREEAVAAPTNQKRRPT